jgi:branched-chain amino acid transport system substrate-binding protein
MLTRRRFVGGVATASATLALVACSGLTQGNSSSDSLYFGVSGPFTGNNAEYGTIWKNSFNLALDEINGAGGIKGRKVELIYEDSQADAKQSVPIAQKFVSDKRILAELGDFASPASMAASPIYQRGKLVQYAITSSHPDFTKGGDFMFSPALTQEVTGKFLAEALVKTLNKRKLALLYLDTDWGQVTNTIHEKHLKSLGAEVVYSGSFLSNEKDFRSLLIQARDAQPDALVIIAYYNEGGLITQQARATGLEQQIVAIGSSYSPRFLELAGDAANGVIMTVPFFPSDSRAVVQNFVKKYETRYHESPDAFAAGAYDALKTLVWAVEKGGAERLAIRDALKNGKDIPSVVYGSFQFGADRRIADATQYIIQVRNGKFELYNK